MILVLEDRQYCLPVHSLLSDQLRALWNLRNWFSEDFASVSIITWEVECFENYIDELSQQTCTPISDLEYHYQGNFKNCKWVYICILKTDCLSFAIE